MHLINCVCINNVEGNEQVLQSLPKSIGQCWGNAGVMPRRCQGSAGLLPGDARAVQAWYQMMLGNAAVMQSSATVVTGQCQVLPSLCQGNDQQCQVLTSQCQGDAYCRWVVPGAAGHCSGAGQSQEVGVWPEWCQGSVRAMPG